MGEIIFILLVQYPGAAIRWFLFRRKPFKEYLKDDPYWNAFPFIMLLILVIVVPQLIMIAIK